MAAKKGKANGGAHADPAMVHDPLAEVDELSSTADDILEGEWLPHGSPQQQGPVKEVLPPVMPSGSTPADQIDLGPSLTIRDVAEMQPQLLQALEAGEGELTLLVADLEQVDGAGVQLLLAFVQEARNRGVVLNWDKVPACLHNAVASMGLSSHFVW